MPAERTPENPLGAYTLAPENVRHLAEEELAEKRRVAEDARGERFRAMYDDLGFRVVAHPYGTLEVGWKFGGNAKPLRTGNDTSPNRHATKHFHSTEHPWSNPSSPTRTGFFAMWIKSLWNRVS